MKKSVYLVILMILATVFRLPAMTAQEAVDRFVSNSTLKYASVGVQVIDLDSARSIASFRPEQANITGVGIIGASLPFRDSRLS